jgi:hypothetical protein
MNGCSYRLRTFKKLLSYGSTSPRILLTLRGLAFARAEVATVEGLVAMMNKRAGVVAEFATGDAAAYLERIAAEGSHLLLEGGKSNILLRADVATRRTALHEWLHRVFDRNLMAVLLLARTVISRIPFSPPSFAHA